MIVYVVSSEWYDGVGFISAVWKVVMVVAVIVMVVVIKPCPYKLVVFFFFLLDALKKDHMGGSSFHLEPT